MKKIILLGDKKTTEIALKTIEEEFSDKIFILGFVSSKTFYQSLIKKKFTKSQSLIHFSFQMKNAMRKKFFLK